MTHEPIFTTALSGVVGSISFAPDGRVLVANTLGGTVAVFEVERDSLKLRTVWNVGAGVTYRASVLPDSGHVLVAVERTLQVWDPEHPSGKPSLVRRIDDASDFTIASKGGVLASSGSQAGVRTWGFPSFRELAPSSEAGEPLCLSASGDLLAAANADGKVSLIDPRSGLLVRALQGHNDAVRALAFSPKRMSLLAAIPPTGL